MTQFKVAAIAAVGMGAAETTSEREARQTQA